MFKKSLLVGSMVFALVLMGAGCGNSAVVETENTGSAVNNSVSTEPENKEYTWEGQNVSFTYPANAFVLDAGTMPDGSFAQVFLSPTSAVSDPNSTDMDGIAINNGYTLERVMQYFKNGPTAPDKTQTTEQIGQQTVTKLQFTNTTSGMKETRYFVALDSDSFLTYSDYDNDFDAKAVLSSLKF